MMKLRFASKRPVARSLIFGYALLFCIAGCGLPGVPNPGGGTCSPVCNGDKVGCPALATNLTALASLHAGATQASTILGVAPQWMGEFAGLKIQRDGTPSPDPDITTVLGTQVKLYTSGWVFKFCAGMNGVGFGAGPQTSSVQEECGTLNCSALAPVLEPKVDSAAAIAAAFPSDPAATLYNVNFMPVLTANKRLWTVSQRGAATQIKVDADTGAIVP